MTPLSRFLLLTLALLTLVRFCLAASLEVTPAEAYQYQLALHRVWIGVDGGGLGTLLVGVGGDSALSLRWMAPLVALLLSVTLWRLIQSMSGERVAAWAVVILNLLPAFNLAACQWHPEWLAAEFTLLGMYWLWLGLHKAGPWEWRWPAAGAAWGLALQCHWAALSVPLGLVCVLSVSRRWRKRWLRPGPWLLLGTWICVGLTPLFWWNSGHAGALVEQWLREFGWAELSWFKGSHWWTWWAQMLVGISPLVLVAMVWSCVRVVRAQRDDVAWFLLSFGLPICGIGCLGAWFGLGQAIWLVPVMPALCGLVAVVWQPTAAVRDQRSLWQWSALSLAAVMSLLLLNTDLLRRAGIVREYSWDIGRTWHGWHETSAEVERITLEVAETVPGGVLLIAETPELAATLDYYLPTAVGGFRAAPDWPRVQVLESPNFQSQYSFWPRYDEDSGDPNMPPPMVGRTALFFTEVEHRVGPPGTLAGSFTTVRPLTVFEVRRYGAVVRRLRVFLCEDYVGGSL